MNTKKYYSYRTGKSVVDFKDAIQKFVAVYRVMVDKDYLKELASIQRGAGIPDTIKNEALLHLPFQPFPIEKWTEDNTTEDQLFDTIEFLFDYISQPFGWEWYDTDGGFNYQDYEGYNKEEGRKVYCEYVNMFLNDYSDGYELTSSGEVITIGTNGLDVLFNANIVEYDYEHIDKFIKDAIDQWRKRNLKLDERRMIIKSLADVFEWLKKNKDLEKVLDRKDDKLIFDIVNNFEIRHHNPEQKGNYDRTIWYSWMFHFYLATYHAVIRMILKGK